MAYGPGGDPRKEDPTRRSPTPGPGYPGRSDPTSPAQTPGNLPYGPGRNVDNPYTRPDYPNTNNPSRG